MMTTDQFFTLWDATRAEHGPAYVLSERYPEQPRMKRMKGIRIWIIGAGECCPVAAAGMFAGLVPQQPDLRLNWLVAGRALGLATVELNAIVRAADNIDTGAGPLHIRRRLLGSVQP